MRDDQAFVHGKTRENAVLLLDAAEHNGYPAYVVEAQDDGFLVPADLIDKIWPPKRDAEE